MKPSPSLLALFTTLLAGCAEEDKGSSSTGAESGCEGSEQTEVVTIPLDEYLKRAGDSGATGATDTGGDATDGATTGDALPPIEFAACVMICQEYGYVEDPYSCEVTASDATNVTITCLWTTTCIGRGHACVIARPGDEPPGEHGEDALAAWLARVAHDEAASVAAFDALHAELAALGAPGSLLDRVRAAAAEEVRHAESFGALARAVGAIPRAPTVVPLPPRDLLALAIENAVEGCVGETWGAIEARYAAARAVDPSLRRLLSQIADDELRHAELAHDLDVWLRERLDDAGRTEVETARQNAARRLGEHLRRRRAEALHQVVGLPEPAIAARLHAGLSAALWSRDAA